MKKRYGFLIILALVLAIPRICPAPPLPPGVTGPSSAVDSNAACFDGTTGRKLKDCLAVPSAYNVVTATNSCTDTTTATMTAAAEGYMVDMTSVNATCTVTVSETNAVQGNWMLITNTSAANTLTFANQAGALALVYGSPAVIPANGSIKLVYETVNNTWVEAWRSPLTNAILGAEPDITTGNLLSAALVAAPAALTAAPASPETGKIYRADASTWDPCTSDANTDYIVYYNGTIYLPVANVDGTPIVQTAAPGTPVTGWHYWADADGTWDPDTSVSGTAPYQVYYNGSAYISVKKLDGTVLVSTYGQISSNGYVTGLMPPVVLTIASGVHDGSNDAATMTDSGESFTTSQFVGMTVYNITDASSCTVTANNGTAITCTLAGGTQNDWDTNDVWQVGPGPYQSGSWFYVVAASTIRHPATAGYTACYESDAAAAIIVDMASDSMIFQGTLDTAVTALDAGDSIDSSGSTTGDFMCIHNKSATEAQGKGKRGVWADGGAT